MFDMTCYVALKAVNAKKLSSISRVLAGLPAEPARPGVVHINTEKERAFQFNPLDVLGIVPTDPRPGHEAHRYKFFDEGSVPAYQLGGGLVLVREGQVLIAWDGSTRKDILSRIYRVACWVPIGSILPTDLSSLSTVTWERIGWPAQPQWLTEFASDRAWFQRQLDSWFELAKTMGQ